MLNRNPSQSLVACSASQTAVNTLSGSWTTGEMVPLVLSSRGGFDWRHSSSTVLKKWFRQLRRNLSTKSSCGIDGSTLSSRGRMCIFSVICSPEVRVHCFCKLDNKKLEYSIAVTARVKRLCTQQHTQHDRRDWTSGTLLGGAHRWAGYITSHVHRVVL